MKLKSYLLSLPSLPRSQEAIRWGWRSGRVLCGRWMSPVLRWIQPVEPAGPVLSSLWRSLHLNCTGVNLQNLRPVSIGSQLCQDALSEFKSKIRLALLNVRSLKNKTFILNDFIRARNLDFLFISETWLNVGDMDVFGELVPSNFNVLSSPRETGRGGGLASVFKDSFMCTHLNIDRFSSFELQVFEIQMLNPVFCAVLYRPPRPNKDFISELSSFLGDVVLNYDKALVLGDFNIHVCCPSSSLSKDFLNLLDSLGFQQMVKGSTHSHGHTLDLILSLGLPVSDIIIDDFVLADHNPILCTVSFPYQQKRRCSVKRCVRPINSNTQVDFNFFFC